ncbi:AEC family transporter [Oceanospirillum sp.]|uniref:AEC family transporter n=1 Tax=Oceanospirillum sp. TaxID=2021254 RepID=UPI003A8E25B0
MDVLIITAPIFLLIGLGFFAVRQGFTPSEAIPGMASFVLYFAIPAVIFSNVVRMDFTTLFDPRFIGVYASATLGSLFLGFGLAHWGMKRKSLHSAVLAVGIATPNSLFIGLPVLVQVFGEVPTVFTMAVMVENLLVVPTALILMERAANDGTSGVNWRAVGGRVIKSPLILSILAGVVVALSGVTVPVILDKMLAMLAQAAGALALFVIGGSLVGMTVREVGTDTLLVSGGKLILQPALAFLVLMCVPGLDDVSRITILLLCAVPMFSIYPIIGGNYGFRRQCAATLLITTLTSFFTLTLLLSFLR